MLLCERVIFRINYTLSSNIPCALVRATRQLLEAAPLCCLCRGQGAAAALHSLSAQFCGWRGRLLVCCGLT